MLVTTAQSEVAHSVYKPHTTRIGGRLDSTIKAIEASLDKNCSLLGLVDPPSEAQSTCCSMSTPPLHYTPHRINLQTKQGLVPFLRLCTNSFVV